MRDVAFDCETYLIQPGRVAPTMVCLTWCNGPEHGILRGKDAVAWLRAQLLDDDVRLWGANVAYDCGVMAETDLTLLPLIFRAYDLDRIADVEIDDMLRNIAIGRHGFDPSMGPRGGKPSYSLEELVSKYLNESVQGKGGEDAWRFRYYELRDVPTSEWPREAVDYALFDAIYTLRVHARQVAELRGGHEIMPTFFDQCRQAWGLHLMGAWGFRTDGKAVAQLDRDLHDLCDQMLDYLTEVGFYRWKGTKKDPRRDGRGKHTALIKERVANAYDALAEENGEEGGGWPLTDGGKEKLRVNEARADAGLEPLEITYDDVSCAGEVLTESGDPDLELLAECEEYLKLRTSFLPVLQRGVELPINPRYNVLVESGRTSCRKPNIQQMPRKGGVRECYVPRQGWIFAGCDYGIAELRSLSQVLLDAYGESAMADSIRAGKDLHVDLAADILGVTYEEAEVRRKAGDKEIKETRQLSKAANFGYPGGLGPIKFMAYARKSYDVRISEEDSRSLKAKWRRKFPEIQRYHGDIGQALEESGGRMVINHPRTGFVRGGTRFCDSCNHYFQHLTAAGAKAAVYEVGRECFIGITRTGEASPLFGCRPVGFVHDELIVEVPVQRIGWDATRAAAARLGEVQREQMARFTPDLAVVAEPHLMRRWYKDADPVYDKDGKLIPWEPPSPSKLLLQAFDKAKATMPPEVAAVIVGAPLTLEVAQAAVEVLGGDAATWLRAQRLYALENISQEREQERPCLPA